jgi:hypothetical protein
MSGSHSSRALQAKKAISFPLLGQFILERVVKSPCPASDEMREEILHHEQGSRRACKGTASVLGKVIDD